MKYPKTIAKLKEIADLLRVHNRIQYANFIEDSLIKNMQKNSFPQVTEDYEQLYLTVWGGSGSIRDIYLCKQNLDVSNDFDESNRRLEQLRVDLSEIWKEEIEK